ncbi:hypothetical protein HanXRQr2_Chr12g0529331 [Helianthus annuus]|uniref:Uncharacterized protein n=1 Tax=Helianthus annuus TaxID=4232 RepID=A0A9K3HEM8_HELAN|nr:hypothetical protein HanXRQr2_Chr12g0529331 [Helianthus annuus]
MMTSRPPLWVAALDGDEAAEHQLPATKIADKARPSSPSSLFVHLCSGGGSGRLLAAISPAKTQVSVR